MTVPGSCYTDEERRMAAAHHAVLGSMAEVSRRAGTPETTLSGWRKQAWWMELVAAVRSEHDDLLGSRMTGLIDDTLEALRYRLQNGEDVLTKDGARRVKVRSRDLAIRISLRPNDPRLATREVGAEPAGTRDPWPGDAANHGRPKTTIAARRVRRKAAQIDRPA